MDNGESTFGASCSELGQGRTSRRGIPEPNTDIYGPEANLHEHVVCQKHPDHKDFIPVKKFNKDHFPEGYQDEWREELVKAVSELTVHLKVSTVSKNRPKYYPDSTDNYPFHIPGGGISPRTASGWVRGVTKCGEGSERYRDQTCDCDVCKTSQSPLNKWWELEVVTATHVVCDSTEVKDTTVTLFFDDKDSKTFVTKGHKGDGAYLDGDCCQFTVIVHDDEVGWRLEKAVDRMDELKSRYCYSGPCPFSVVVSHPHGCSKHVTVGEWVGREWPWQYESPVYYTASTCPGSSGGMVMVDPWSERGLYVTYPHSVAMPDGTSRSGEWWSWWN